MYTTNGTTNTKQKVRKTPETNAEIGEAVHFGREVQTQLISASQLWQPRLSEQ